MNSELYEAIIRELLYIIDYQKKMVAGLNLMIQKGVKIQNSDMNINLGPNQNVEKEQLASMNNDLGRQVFFDNLFSIMANKNPNKEVDKVKFLHTLKGSGLFTQTQAIQFLNKAENEGLIVQVAQNTLIRKNMEEGSITHE
jgi:hypothetical protein